ncbi:MAG: adenylyltransferase/cytidyltransferase family protein [Candidatus Omnitrophica bacterium]|jgi:cytidyltransferase-like protein|nr:adenylyltransferase/cytidyltransferase family protein [Candidatus Omnitrophota bacterium]
MTVGYASGVFDLFHIGHLRLLETARGLCDRLVVGVSTDELVFDYKKRWPVIPFAERAEIVRSLRCVEAVVRRDVRDKKVEWEKIRFDVCFVGDDWYGKDEWKRWTEWMAGVGVKTVYLPYSSGRSTSSIIDSIRNGRKMDNEF